MGELGESKELKGEAWGFLSGREWLPLEICQ